MIDKRQDMREQMCNVKNLFCLIWTIINPMTGYLLFSRNYGKFVSLHSNQKNNKDCFDCWSFKSWQHLWSYQDGHRLVTANLCWLYSAVPLGNLAAGAMTRYPIQSHYPHTELTSILLIPNARLGSDEYQFYISMIWLNQEANFQN